MLVKLLFFLTVVTLGATQETDYCDNEALGCKRGNHIGCQWKGKTLEFNLEACAKKNWTDVRIMQLEVDKQIKQIVDLHNQKRDEAAKGNAVAGVSGTRLCTMNWSEELALIASYNVYACTDDHDECRNTLDFPFVGQNIYNWFGTRETSDEAAILKGINSWYEERNKANETNIRKKVKGVKGIGHFTQMVWSSSCYIGCSIARYQSGKFKSGYFVCNYDFGNMVENEVYPVGPTASECKTGPNAEYTGLCSVQEAPLFENPKGKKAKNDKERPHLLLAQALNFNKKSPILAALASPPQPVAASVLPLQNIEAISAAPQPIEPALLSIQPVAAASLASQPVILSSQPAEAIFAAPQPVPVIAASPPPPAQLVPIPTQKVAASKPAALQKGAAPAPTQKGAAPAPTQKGAAPVPTQKGAAPAPTQKGAATAQKSPVQKVAPAKKVVQPVKKN